MIIFLCKHSGETSISSEVCQVFLGNHLYEDLLFHKKPFTYWSALTSDLDLNEGNYNKMS